MYAALRNRTRSSALRLNQRTMASLVKPQDWKAKAPSSLPGPTFAAQATLPKLPVPDLPETLAKLKDTLKPIAWSESEYAEVLKKIDEFGSTLGPELQKRLLERKENTAHWFEEWWDELAYMGYRDSVIINVSYYYGFDDHPAHLPQSSISRAAAIARAGMQFRQLFKLGKVQPEATKEGPLCMDTWRFMFDCCRIPGSQGSDWAVSYAKEGEIGNTGHIAVLRKGRVWKLDAWQNGRLLSVEELETQLQYIVENTTHEYPAVPILTASNRDVWAKDYATLASDPHNDAILEAIQSASFVICLDTETPQNFIEHSRDLWHGAVTRTPSGVSLGLRNRWADKPVNFIVFENGKAGILGEHSVMDGTPTVTLCDNVLDIIADPKFDQGKPQEGVTASLPVPLDFKVSDATKEAIAKAEKAALELIETQDLNVVQTKYGKAAIKKFGVSPDSWAQMIVQLAYGRLLNDLGLKREGGTYEAATTRKFFKGRTEAIRVVSSESDAWVKSMDDPSVSKDEKKKLFGLAAKKHIAYAKMAGNGQGIDRHLLGLQLSLQNGETVPAMYSDPVYQRSKNWVLSTSAIFSKHFHPYGWGEVVPKGFGVAYMTGYDDYLQFTISSRVEMPNEKFCAELSKAAQDLFDLHSQTTAKL
ncbi:carnitine acetyl transferase [Abortiporus biennis]|nr:carnitine acetyl transferase [Abortiporus biennis]